MGRKTAEVRAYASLSSNNDERDEQDRAVWEEFLAEVRALAGKPEYADIEIQINDQGTY